MTSKPGRYGIEDLWSTIWFRPGYWKTLANLLFTAHPRVVLDGSSLRFTRYPFRPATVFPSGLVEADQVAEVNLGGPTQKLRLKNGDILFVLGAGKEALLSFINQNDIPIVRRSSVWGALLDPFLDTWEDQETIDQQFECLANLGLDRGAVEKWRREVAVAMIAYNFGSGLWEWAYLDFYEVLVAQRARLTRAAFADFYSRAIRLAALDPVIPDGSSSISYDISSTLFAVLLDWYPRKKPGSLKNFHKEWELRIEGIERLKKRLIAELTSAYSEPHRRYHTLAHIEMGLQELGKSWHCAVNLNEVKWALLFHDAIYDPQRQDNEARSADWACRVMEELHRPEDEKARVRGMILATAHSNEPRTPDEALVLDIDLSILAADEAAFDEYDRSIRAEYQWVPESSYRQARAEILESFIQRKHIYHTALYRKRYESSARRNIERALARLRAG